MTSPAHELATYLASQGVGIFAGNDMDEWAISVGIEPASPDKVVTLYDEGGGEPDTDDLDIFRPLVRIRVRGPKGAGYVDAYAKHEEIRDLLITPAPLITQEIYFVGLRLASDIASQGKDDNERPVLAAVYEAELQTGV